MAALYVSPEVRQRAHRRALECYSNIMRLGTKDQPSSARDVFELATAHLAFARLLEEHMLDMLRQCPDREMAREIEESAAAIAAQLLRDLPAKGPR